ncbi:MAG: DUF2924 domain-containing protein [Candidatus Tectomicrobia bacterium]|uniref:DUF2924 domain-containing protein n=1 Tax=Tectimicrobiota bacterium TaxID=2528274 RepID=A0A932I1H6_UNCTE|nr:DUF2924 domain-containing protein [Candidatus Tectomicrobia bacterium]
MDANLEVYLEKLKQLSPDELHDAWHSQLGCPAPTGLNAPLLRQLLAWRIQEHAFGGLSSESRLQLRRLTTSLGRNPDHSLTPNLGLKPGTILEREWQGVRHRVRVLDAGFEYVGERFDSLSKVARRITGTRWSGPLFFGLRK